MLWMLLLKFLIVVWFCKIVLVSLLGIFLLQNCALNLFLSKLCIENFLLSKLCSEFALPKLCVLTDFHHLYSIFVGVVMVCKLLWFIIMRGYIIEIALEFLIFIQFTANKVWTFFFSNWRILFFLFLNFCNALCKGYLFDSDGFGITSTFLTELGGFWIGWAFCLWIGGFSSSPPLFGVEPFLFTELHICWLSLGRLILPCYPILWWSELVINMKSNWVRL